MSDDLYSDVRLITETLNSLDANVAALDPNEKLDSNLIAFAAIQDAKRVLGLIESDLEKKLAAVMSRTTIVEGVGTFEKHKRKNRTQWDKDALLSAVMDSRLFNPHTGELKEETPLEKFLAVFNQPAPRLTALRDRGIDPDQFCHSEDAGYQIRLVS